MNITHQIDPVYTKILLSQTSPFLFYCTISGYAKIYTQNMVWRGGEASAPGDFIQEAGALGLCHPSSNFLMGIYFCCYKNSNTALKGGL